MIGKRGEKLRIHTARARGLLREFKRRQQLRGRDECAQRERDQWKEERNKSLAPTAIRRLPSVLRERHRNNVRAKHQHIDERKLRMSAKPLQRKCQSQ